MAILSTFLTVVIVLVSLLLILLVLVQRPKQEGLGAAFGGGTFDSALGAHTTDILKKMTTYLATIFFISAIALAVVKARNFGSAGDILEKVETRQPASSGLPSIDDLTAPGGSDIPLIKDPTPEVKPAEAPQPATPAPSGEQ